MKTHEFDTYIKFQQLTVTKDVNFQPTTTTETLFDAWAMVENRGGVQFTKYSTPEPRATHIMIMYSDQRIVQGLRISDHNGNHYKIIAINKLTTGRSRYVQLDVEQEKVSI